jgi:integrase
MEEKLRTRKRKSGNDVLIGLEQREDFIGFFKNLILHRERHNNTCLNYDLALRYVIHFVDGKEFPFKKVNSEWLMSFKTYLESAGSFKNKSKLSTTSAATYFRIVHSVVREAVDCKRIEAAAVNFSSVWHRADASTHPLSAHELQKLAQAECRHPIIKKAFLFSALTGIQWQELESFKWEHIKVDEQGQSIVDLADQIEPRQFPLSDQAWELLGAKEELQGNVFGKLQWNTYLYVTLNKWAISAGILRTLTFQTARVTFAHLLYHQNVPVEIISELLGHKNVKSTIRMVNVQSSPAA